MQAQTPEVSTEKATTAAVKKTLTLEVIAGMEGPSAYIDDHRIAGPKPWGGGQVKHNFKVKLTELLRAVPGLTYAQNAQPSSGWTNKKPTIPGAYYVRGFRLGEINYRPALVEVDYGKQRQLICNINERNSEDDLREWSYLEDCADRFEWLGPLVPMGGR